MASKLLLAALLAGAALAKTDLNGCVSYETIITVPNRPDVYPYGSLIWYVPDSGEVCEFLDCGGGRAPPKTTVPGCGAYKGTETYSPKFIDPKTLGQAPQTDAATSGAVTESPAVTTESLAATTESPSASAVASEVEESSSAPVLTSLPTLTQTGSFVESLLTTTAAVAKTTAAPEGSSSHKASSASNGAASSPAPTSSSVSTAAAGAMPTAGGMLALAAGAAVYAGMA